MCIIDDAVILRSCFSRSWLQTVPLKLAPEAFSGFKDIQSRAKQAEGNGTERDGFVVGDRDIENDPEKIDDGCTITSITSVTSNSRKFQTIWWWMNWNRTLWRQDNEYTAHWRLHNCLHREAIRSSVSYCHRPLSFILICKLMFSQSPSGSTCSSSFLLLLLW